MTLGATSPAILTRALLPKDRCDFRIRLFGTGDMCGIGHIAPIPLTPQVTHGFVVGAAGFKASLERVFLIEQRQRAGS